MFFASETLMYHVFIQLVHEVLFNRFWMVVETMVGYSVTVTHFPAYYINKTWMISRFLRVRQISY